MHLFLFEFLIAAASPETVQFRAVVPLIGVEASSGLVNFTPEGKTETCACMVGVSERENCTGPLFFSKACLCDYVDKDLSFHVYRNKYIL